MLMKEYFPMVFACESNPSFEVADAEFYSYGEQYDSTTEKQDSAIEHAVLSHDKMTEQLTLHRSIFVHMLENIAPTATIEDVEKVQDLVYQIDEVLGNE